MEHIFQQRIWQLRYSKLPNNPSRCYQPRIVRFCIRALHCISLQHTCRLECIDRSCKLFPSGIGQSHSCLARIGRSGKRNLSYKASCKVQAQGLILHIDHFDRRVQVDTELTGKGRTLQRPHTAHTRRFDWVHI